MAGQLLIGIPFDVVANVDMNVADELSRPVEQLTFLTHTRMGRTGLLVLDGMEWTTSDKEKNSGPDKSLIT